MDKDRRQFMKSAGIALTTVSGLGASGLVSGRGPRRANQITESEYHDLLEQRKEKNWGTNRWRSEIAKRSTDFKYKDYGVRLSKGPEGNLSPTVMELKPVNKRQPDIDGNNDKPQQKTGLKPQSINEDEHCKLKLTYTRPSSGSHKLNFTYSLDDPWHKNVQGPRDYATMSIDTDDYDWEGDPRYGSWSGAPDAVGATGFSYRNAYHRVAKHANRSIGWFESYVENDINPISGSQYTRKIYVDYIHRWDNTEISGMSVSSNGKVSITFKSYTDLWRAETNAEEWQMDDGDTYIDDKPT